MATFCLIAGNWHDGSSWEYLIKPLRSRGHEAIAPDLPTDAPQAGWEQRIEPALRALERVDGPIVIVAHSASAGYGELVASHLDGPLLVHLCPRYGHLEAPAGAPAPFRPGFPFPPRRADGANVWEREAAIDAMYQRLPRDMAEELADRLRPAAPPADEFPLAHPYEGPTALIFAGADEFFEPEWERFVAREMLGVEPIELSGGHFPMAEDPESLADVLDRLARGASG